MSRNTLTVIGICVVLAAILFFFYRDGDVVNFPAKEGPIVAFGDSLVYGTGSTMGNDFVSILSRRIGEPIENLGLPGRTTEMGFEALGEVLERSPRITLILLGGNDYLRKIPIDETFYNLREMVKALQAEGSITVILGVRGGLLMDRYDSYFEDLAEETGSFYVSDVLDGLLADSRYMSDAIHPNDAGYARIAERVYEVIRDIVR